MKKFFNLTVVFTILCFFNVNGGETSQSENKNVFITGAAGFIGSNFLNYMFEKYPDYHFTVLDALTYAGNLENIPAHIKESDRFHFVHGCVTDVELVDKIMADANFVVHFAAESHVTRSILDDYVFFNTDVLGTRAMLAALVNHKQNVERFVHISTSEVYGTADYEPMDEKHPLKPRSPYAAAKAAADRLVYSYGCTYDVPAVIIRPFNNFGPRQHLEKMIPHFIASAIRQEPLTIHGHGSQTRDWVHTKDTARAIDKVLHMDDFEQIRNQEINIGTGVDTSVLEIAEMILDYFGLNKLEYLKFVADRPGQVDTHIADITKAKEILGWEPTITMKEGIISTIKWYLANENHWRGLQSEELVCTDQINTEASL